MNDHMGDRLESIGTVKLALFYKLKFVRQEQHFLSYDTLKNQ